MPIYAYPCAACGLTTEAVRPLSCVEIACACGAVVRRSAANRVAVAAPAVDTRGMFRRFQTATQEMDYAASKIERETGQRPPAPSLWNAAKERARAMQAAGEASVPRPKD